MFGAMEEEEERSQLGRECFTLKEVEKIGELFSNHALESDDKEESEYASPMIISYNYLS